jgi:hypothetical protein
MYVRSTYSLLMRNTMLSGRVELGWVWERCERQNGQVELVRMWAYHEGGGRRFSLEAPAQLRTDGSVPL